MVHQNSSFRKVQNIYTSNIFFGIVKCNVCLYFVLLSIFNKMIQFENMFDFRGNEYAKCEFSLILNSEMQSGNLLHKELKVKC